MSKQDVYLVMVISVLVLGVVSILTIAKVSNGASVASVTVDGQSMFRVPLAQDQVVDIKGRTGISQIEVKDGKVRMKQAVCPDEICLKRGWIKGSGAIICMPERIAVTLEGDRKKTNAIVH